MMGEPRGYLFVCTGNTCRSPMAEALWKARVGTGGIPAWSAGVSAWSGQPAQALAVEAVAALGGDLSIHLSRDLSEVTENPWRVLTMTAAQTDAVKALRPEWASRTSLLTEFVGDCGDIPDPIGQGREAYAAAAARLKELLARLPEQADRAPESVGGKTPASAGQDSPSESGEAE
ncbi:MAG: low molecular weight protein arginine phosphatase [Thermaerobacter sp.]|nr:low molecular weight protein arginine phosphatase [Thermaerobacter sp.]